MNVFQKIIKKHKDYYKAQEAIGQINIKKLLLGVIVASIYFSFWYYGTTIYLQTIIGQKEIFTISFIITTIIFIALFFILDKWKEEMSIITNAIIYYAHTILFFCFILVTLNYLSLDEHFKTTKLFVEKWELHKGRHPNTSAKVMYNGKVSLLRFEGDIIQEAKQVDSLIVEINTGILEYGYVKSFKLDKD